MKLLQLAKSLIFSRSWIFILCLSLVSAGSAATASWKLKDLIDQRSYSVLQHSFDEFKLNQSNSINTGNTAVINKIATLLDNLKGFQVEFKKSQDADKLFSESLKKELYDANGKSCPLSPAVEHYLDRLRVNQQSRRVN